MEVKVVSPQSITPGTQRWWFLVLGMVYLNAAEPLQGNSLLVTIKSSGVPGTRFIDLGEMKSYIDLRASPSLAAEGLREYYGVLVLY